MAAIPISVGIRFVIASTFALIANWDTIAHLFDATREEDTLSFFGYRYHAILEWQEGTGGAWLDRGELSVAFVNITSGDLDTTWTSGDFAAIESGFEAFFTSMQTYMPTGVRLVEHRWYAFGPGVTTPNPVARVTTLVTPIAGTSVTASARQIACAMTLKTSLRKHWGRFYMPLGGSAYTSFGRLTTTAQGNIATALHTFLRSGVTQQVLPVVYDHNQKVAWGVTAYQVDDIPDVIRRRRPSTTVLRSAGTIVT